MAADGMRGCLAATARTSHARRNRDADRLIALACYDYDPRLGHDNHGEACEIREPNAWHRVSEAVSTVTVFDMTDAVGHRVKNDRFVAHSLEHGRRQARRA